MADRFTIVGLGEALFDVFPDRDPPEVLGGAPLNVAVHAHQLALGRGGRGVVVSRIGQDNLGRQLLEALAQRGMTTDFLQSDPDRSTGQVYVDTTDPHDPQYDIAAHVAWDWLQFDPDAESLARGCQAVCFGTLAQREAQTRNAIMRFLEVAQRAIRLFDVNLRQHYYDHRILRRSCEYATAAKLNHRELEIVNRELGIDAPPLDSAEAVDQQAMALLRKFKLKQVFVTRGEQGMTAYTASGPIVGEPANYAPVQGADGVGAGDAASAGVLVGLLLRWPLERIVTLANHAGAFVHGQRGATPALPQSILDMVK
ncbi:MAG: PfkB family carbohydrate kinase [Phycisphaeraceae bacterium]